LEAGWAKLEASAERAKAAGFDEHAARALINLVETGRDLKRFDWADRYADEALAYVVEHDLDLYRRRLIGDLAELALERGRWDEAAGRATGLVGESRTAPVVRAKALAVIGRLRARRGEGDPWPPLDEALELIGPSGDDQDLCPTYLARSEAAWLEGDDARATEEARRGLAQAARHPFMWWLGEASFWAWRAGLLEQLPDGAPSPYLLHVTGHHREAALAWHRLGCPYHKAQALADSADAGDLRESLELCHALGAMPLARLVGRHLHDMGAVGIARGPRHSTRLNPFGLTDRELQVLSQLVDELSNTEIAERLVLSPKTVDHHVSAILRKLGVHDRSAAARMAMELPTKDGEATDETWGTW
jgi:DNA-binding CsgD family transcriptional regulator